MKFKHLALWTLLPFLFGLPTFAAQKDDARIAQLPKSTLSDKAQIGFWNFDDGSGAVAKDSSGAKNHAKIEGTIAWTKNAAPGTPKSAGSLLVDGKTYALAAKPEDLNTIAKQITMVAWIKRTKEAKRYGCVMSRQIKNGGGEHYGIYFKAGKLGFMVNIHTKGGAKLWTKKPLPLNKWIHVAAVADGQKIHLYVDGKQVAEQAYKNTFAADYTQLVISGNANGPKGNVGECYIGHLNNVGIYNYGLTAKEVAKLAGSGAGTDTKANTKK
jgi:hypothetical protein